MKKKYDKNINDFRNLEDLHKTQFIYITNIHDESPYKNTTHHYHSTTSTYSKALNTKNVSGHEMINILISSFLISIYIYIKRPKTYSHCQPLKDADQILFNVIMYKYY